METNNIITQMKDLEGVKFFVALYILFMWSVITYLTYATNQNVYIQIGCTLVEVVIVLYAIAKAFMYRYYYVIERSLNQ